MAKPASSCSLPPPHSFSLCKLISLSPRDFPLSRVTAALMPAVKLADTQMYGARQIFSAWMGDDSSARTFAGCNFAWRKLGAHLCACWLRRGRTWTGRTWRYWQEEMADPVLCCLSCKIAKSQLLIMLQHFPF